jgi:hypothetical protein
LFLWKESRIANNLKVHVSRKTVGLSASEPLQHTSHVAGIELAGAGMAPLSICSSASQVKEQRKQIPRAGIPDANQSRKQKGKGVGVVHI